MKLLTILLTLGLSQMANASGCIYYDSFLSILKRTHFKDLERKDYQTIGFSKNHYSIVLNSQPDNILTLVKIAETSFEEVSLTLEDIVFTEGHGCGPVYDCETGRITLKNSKGIFSWPGLKEFRDFRGADSSAMRTLMPVFGDSTINSDTSLAQCKYGYW